MLNKRQRRIVISERKGSNEASPLIVLACYMEGFHGVALGGGTQSVTVF